MSRAAITARGARRWAAGHPWIYRSDLREEPDPPRPGIVAVHGPEGRFLGQALYSPTSEIRLRLLTAGDEPVDAAWWRHRIAAAGERRHDIDATGFRAVHAEADGLPSLVVDRYGPYAVAQLLSAGLEACRADVVDAIADVLEPEGILLRNDVPVRRHEELPQTVELADGSVPHHVAVREGAIQYLVDPWTGQKTGAFLDQRENRALAGARAHGRGLDLFTYEGGFALHLARGGRTVLAVDQSSDALARARENAAANGLENIEWCQANVFDLLRDLERADERFDIIVLDPPAFAKSRAHVDRALRGYKELNLRALRLLEIGGSLLTFSCSYHVGRDRFLPMLTDAARDSGRSIVLERLLGASADHPEVLAIPETGYLKGALVSLPG